MVVKKELQEIQEAVNPYTNEDVYNIGKFELFWKMTTDKTLGTEQSAGSKYDKKSSYYHQPCLQYYLVS